MITAAELAAIAYKKEKVASRRLAQASGLSAAAALEQVLTAVAGKATLAELVALRLRERAHAAAKALARKQASVAARAQKLAAQQADPAAWQAWFDGSCHPNPGKMGIGGLLRSPQGERTEISFVAGPGDSSEAEYIALISVLEAALEAGVRQLHIYGDSQVVINDVQLKVGGAAILATRRLKAQELLSRLPQVTLGWIPRQKNGQADALSQQAIRSSAASAAPHLA
jgi:ribonuclease HI